MPRLTRCGVQGPLTGCRQATPWRQAWSLAGGQAIAVTAHTSAEGRWRSSVCKGRHRPSSGG
eukprot:8010141-Lingulodinium_polyedra.AAC.1